MPCACGGSSDGERLGAVSSRPPTIAPADRGAWSAARAARLHTARAHVGALAESALSADRRADALLLMSELVNNGLLHGRPGQVRVVARLDMRRLRVEVYDPGPGIGDRLLEAPVCTSPNGRGLVLVDALADRWGHRDGSPAMVWFEIDREAPATPGWRL
jgi:anti-sigma regulatory factor (Ser/Thr protein kinase)